MTRAAPARDTQQTGNPALGASVFESAELAAGAKTMTVRGAAAKTFVFLAVFVAFGWYGWNQVTPDPLGRIRWPGWTWFVLLGAFAVAMVTVFNPKGAALTGAIYAALQGMALGAISHIYEVAWHGIVLQAVVLTCAVALGVLVLYGFGIIKASPRLIKGIIAATIGVALLYLFGFILSLFDVNVLFWDEPNEFTIFVSVVIVGIAALNLVLDFASIEAYAAAGAPKHMEWYSAFGLMVTLIWLYIEILRLIAISRR